LGIITKLIDSFPSTDVERFCIDSSQPSKKIQRAHLENDDAQVPVYLWDEAIVPDGDPLKLTSLNTIRTFALCWWKRHTTKEFLEWMAKKYPSPFKISVGI
jgi:hypothetical protein